MIGVVVAWNYICFYQDEQHQHSLFNKCPQDYNNTDNINVISAKSCFFNFFLCAPSFILTLPFNPYITTTEYNAYVLHDTIQSGGVDAAMVTQGFLEYWVDIFFTIFAIIQSLRTSETFLCSVYYVLSRCYN